MVQKLNVKIRGIRGLLMNRNTSVGVDDQPKSIKKRSTEHNFTEEAKQCLYIRKDGKIGVPSLAILASMKKAAVNMKKSGAGKKTMKDYVYPGLQIECDDDKYILITPQKYSVDVQAVCPTGSGRIPKARPLFDSGWELNFKIVIVDDKVWGPGEVMQCLSEAGLYSGLLDYRPLYGQFEVVSITDEQGEEIK